jgi:hypothetical protein
MEKELQKQIDDLYIKIQQLENKLGLVYLSYVSNIHESNKPECVANKGVSENIIKPNFIPDWKDAPEDAVCVAMDMSGIWFWWKRIPIFEFGYGNQWGVDTGNGLSNINHYAGSCHNKHLLPLDYWKGTLMMRPEANASKVINYKFELDLTQPKTEAEKDYTHLLPDGYEFCSEEDAEKWVKVEMKNIHDNDEFRVGSVRGVNIYKGTWLPIRPIQYKVTTHEITTAIPDPYMPDWSKAPEGTVAHAWDRNGMGYWYIRRAGNTQWEGWHISSNLTLPADLDWMQSLRVKPSK